MMTALHAPATPAILSPVRIIQAGGRCNDAHQWGVHASPRIESAPGKKDHKKMLEFIRAARKALQS